MAWRDKINKDTYLINNLLFKLLILNCFKFQQQ